MSPSRFFLHIRYPSVVSRVDALSWNNLHSEIKGGKIEKEEGEMDQVLIVE